MKDITIKPALNGWKVKVGCQEVLFTNRKTMFKEISRYINDPDKVEAEYLNKAKNKVGGTITYDGIFGSSGTFRTISGISDIQS